MNPFLMAHGYDPGPTQRPTLAGSLTGIAATTAALPLLWFFGALAVEARILGLTLWVTIVAGTAAMAIAGALYGWLFKRAANDPCGGWLFGMAYGFALWAAGAVMVLPAASGGSAPAGKPAIGIMLALLAWGTALGALFPHLHRRLHARIDEDHAGKLRIGPMAAADPGLSNRRRQSGGRAFQDRMK